MRFFDYLGDWTLISSVLERSALIGHFAPDARVVADNPHFDAVRGLTTEPMSNTVMQHSFDGDGELVACIETDAMRVQMAFHRLNQLEHRFEARLKRYPQGAIRRHRCFRHHEMIRKRRCA